MPTFVIAGDAGPELSPDGPGDKRDDGKDEKLFWNCPVAGGWPVMLPDACELMESWTDNALSYPEGSGLEESLPVTEICWVVGYGADAEALIVPEVATLIVSEFSREDGTILLVWVCGCSKGIMLVPKNSLHGDEELGDADVLSTKGALDVDELEIGLLLEVQGIVELRNRMLEEDCAPGGVSEIRSRFINPLTFARAIALSRCHSRGQGDIECKVCHTKHLAQGHHWHEEALSATNRTSQRCLHIGR